MKTKTEVLGFMVNRVVVEEDEIKFQMRNIDGEKVEVGLGLGVDPFSGELSTGFYPHFSDPESVPWFEDSIPWDVWYEQHGIPKPV